MTDMVATAMGALQQVSAERDRLLSEKLRLYHTCNAVEAQRNEALNNAANLQATVELLSAQVRVLAERNVQLDKALEAANIELQEMAAKLDAKSDELAGETPLVH